MRPKTVLPVRLPVFDYEGYAARLVRQCRAAGLTPEGVAAAASEYARLARDQDVATEAARVVGQDCAAIRACPLPERLMRDWAEKAIAQFPPEVEVSDRKLAAFFARMFRELHAAQWEAGALESAAQARAAAEQGDEVAAEKWTRVAARMESARRSI